MRNKISSRIQTEQTRNSFSKTQLRNYRNSTRQPLPLQSPKPPGNKGKRPQQLKKGPGRKHREYRASTIHWRFLSGGGGKTPTLPSMTPICASTLPSQPPEPTQTRKQRIGVGKKSSARNLSHHPYPPSCLLRQQPSLSWDSD